VLSCDNPTSVVAAFFITLSLKAAALLFP